MKRVIFLSAVLTILALMLTGCEKPEPPAPVVFYTLSTNIGGKGSVNPDKLSGIVLGSNVNLKFTPEIGYSLYSVKINGVKIEDIQPSTTEVSYTIQNINKNQYIEVVFVETYNIIISTILNKNPWKLKKIDIYKEDGSFLFSVEDIPQDVIERRTFYYYNYPSTNYIESLRPDNSQSFYTSWSINQVTLRVDMMNYTVLVLTNTNFVYKAPPVIGSDGTYTYAQYTYERTAN